MTAIGSGLEGWKWPGEGCDGEKPWRRALGGSRQENCLHCFLLPPCVRCRTPESCGAGQGWLLQEQWGCPCPQGWPWEAAGQAGKNVIKQENDAEGCAHSNPRAGWVLQPCSCSGMILLSWLGTAGASSHGRSWAVPVPLGLWGCWDGLQGHPETLQDTQKHCRTHS